jgi:hypothetical protein
MNPDDDAEEFRTFVEMSDTEARDEVAFAEFTSNIRSAVQCAVMSNAGCSTVCSRASRSLRY